MKQVYFAVSMIAAVNALGGNLNKKSSTKDGTSWKDAGASWEGLCKTGTEQSPIRIGAEAVNASPDT